MTPAAPHRPGPRGWGRSCCRLVPGTLDVRSTVISRSTLTARRPLVPAALGVTLTALVASGVAWSATGSTATLALDGTTRQVDYRGDTVADVLESAGLTVGEHDALVPSADTEIEDGETVSLRRGRQLELVVDGVTRTVWTTADDVDEALQQFGLRGQGLALSASRSRSIPLGGLSLSVTTPKTISIVADGRTTPRTTTQPTVRDALMEAGIGLDGDDRLSHLRADPVVAGLVVRVTRVKTVKSTERGTVAFSTVRRQDPDLVVGTTRTVTAGKAGVVSRTIATTYADGKVEKRAVLATTTVSKPVTRVLAVGTKPRPARTSSTSSGPRQGTGDVDSLNWPALAQCESGGNPRAVSSTGKYRGLYQFSYATWQSVGGSGDPAANSSGEQTYRAKLLYKRSGAGQWPECGRRLFT